MAQYNNLDNELESDSSELEDNSSELEIDNSDQSLDGGLHKNYSMEPGIFEKKKDAIPNNSSEPYIITSVANSKSTAEISAPVSQEGNEYEPYFPDDFVDIASDSPSSNVISKEELELNSQTSKRRVEANLRQKNITYHYITDERSDSWTPDLNFNLRTALDEAEIPKESENFFSNCSSQDQFNAYKRQYELEEEDKKIIAEQPFWQDTAYSVLYLTDPINWAASAIAEASVPAGIVSKIAAKSATAAAVAKSAYVGGVMGSVSEGANVAAGYEPSGSDALKRAAAGVVLNSMFGFLGAKWKQSVIKKDQQALADIMSPTFDGVHPDYESQRLIYQTNEGIKFQKFDSLPSFMKSALSVTPVGQGALSKSPAMRKIMANSFESDISGEFAGELGASVETEIKLAMQEAKNTCSYFMEEFNEYKKQTGNSWENYCLDCFKAIRHPEEVVDPAVARTAKRFREDQLGFAKEAHAEGVLDIDPESSSFKNYLTEAEQNTPIEELKSKWSRGEFDVNDLQYGVRLWDSRKVRQALNSEDFKSKIRNGFIKDAAINGETIDKKTLELKVRGTLEHLAGLAESENYFIPNLNPNSVAGGRINKPRSILSDDSLFSDFMEKDIVTLYEHMCRKVRVPTIEKQFLKKHGYEDWSQVAKNVEKEYNELIFSSAGDEIEALTKQKNQDLQLVKDTSLLLNGQYGRQGALNHPHLSALIQAKNCVLTWSRSGMFMLSSLNDQALLYQQIGMKRLVESHVKEFAYMLNKGVGFLTGGKYKPNPTVVSAMADDLRTIGVGMERANMDTLSRQLEIGANAYENPNMFRWEQKTLEKMRGVTDFAVKHSTLPRYNDYNSIVVSTYNSNDLLKAALQKVGALEKYSDKVTKRNLTDQSKKIARMGLTSKNLDAIAQQFEEHGEVYKGVLFPNLRAWTNLEAKNSFALALNTANRQSVLVPSVGEYPRALMGLAGRAAINYQSFLSSYFHKIVLPAYSGQLDKIKSTAMLMGVLGGCSIYLKSFINGREPYDLEDSDSLKEFTTACAEDFFYQHLGVIGLPLKISLGVGLSAFQDNGQKALEKLYRNFPGVGTGQSFLDLIGMGVRTFTDPFLPESEYRLNNAFRIAPLYNNWKLNLAIKGLGEITGSGIQSTKDIVVRTRDAIMD